MENVHPFIVAKVLEQEVFFTETCPAHRLNNQGLNKDRLNIVLWITGKFKSGLKSCC